jgi:sugar-specific transcriptional regulator TrmB
VQKVHIHHTSLMDQISEHIGTYFAKLGLSQEIADIYLALHLYGPQSISQLSRSSNVERTHIYRLLEELTSSNLIEVEGRRRRGVIKAAPIANLNILISKREQELKNLQDELSLIEQVLARNSISSPATRFQLYMGSEGIQQMLLNQTKANSKVYSILFKNMQITTKDRFFERWIATCNEAGLQFESVVGDTFIQTQKSWYAKHPNERLAHWEERYVAEKEFSIRHTTIIYDEVVGYFNWKDGDIFGVEIYSRNIADSHLQLFKLLWQQARPIDT